MNPCALILLEFNLLRDWLNTNPNELWNRILMSLGAMKVHIMTLYWNTISFNYGVPIEQIRMEGLIAQYFVKKD